MKRSSFLPGLFWAAADLAVLGLAAASLLGFLGPLWLPLDNLAHFRVQYLVLLAPLVLIHALRRRRWQAGSALAFALLNLALILPLYAKPVSAQAAAATPVYRLFSANILRNNPHHDLILQQILDTQPDLVLLTEYTPAWQTALESVLDDYPYAAQLPQEGYFGLAILSKYPLHGAREAYFGNSPVASIVTTVSLPAGELVFIGTHPVPPRARQNIALRNQQMEAMADYIGTLTGPRLVAGDLNSSSWSPFFWDWLRRSGLRDSRAGFGIQPTWPADQSLLMRLALSTTLDHVLVSPDIRVIAHTPGTFAGSDHLPVILDFSLSNTTPTIINEGTP